MFRDVVPESDLIIVLLGRKYGVINYSGEYILPCIYNNINISNNIITASKSLIDYIFNENGELLYIVKKSATLDTEVLAKVSAL